MDLDLYARLLIDATDMSGVEVRQVVNDIAGIIHEMDGPEQFRREVLDACARVIGVLPDE